MKKAIVYLLLMLSVLVPAGCAANQNQTSSPSPVSAPETPIAVDNTSTVSYTELEKFLSQPVDELLAKVKETPVQTEENGMEFKQLGIKVTVYLPTKTIIRISTQNERINFDGNKVGSPLEGFVGKFGEPVSAANNVSVFVVGDVKLSVGVDSDTKKTTIVTMEKVAMDE